MHQFQRLGDLTWVLSADAKAPAGREILHRETVVPSTLRKTFAFFSDAINLERLTPPWLRFSILTPSPIRMRAGALIDYRVRIYGLPVPWTSRIDVWEPGVRFVDRQLVGPYRWWRHEHLFEEVPGGTRVIDHVEYVPRASWLSGGFVRGDLERIFSYRQHALRQIFIPAPKSPAAELARDRSS